MNAAAKAGSLCGLPMPVSCAPQDGPIVSVTGQARVAPSGVIPPLSKLLVLLVMLAAFLAAWASGLNRTSLIIKAVGLVLIGGYIITRPSPAAVAAAGKSETR